jgi:glycosyltransferase 2 family protein
METPAKETIANFGEFVTRAPARAFAVSRHARRYRRPTDVTLLIFTSATLLWFSARADGQPSGLHAALITVINSLPGLLDPLWHVLSDWPPLWALVLIGLAAYRRHWSLVRDQFVALVGVLIGAWIIGRLATGEWPALWRGLLRQDQPIDYPPLMLAAAVAVISVASPHMSRPMRYVGRWLVVLGAFGSMTVGLALPGHAAGAVMLGWAVAAAVHLALGSPGGLPSLDRVQLGLAGMGIRATPIDVESRGGVAWVRATADDGTDLDVKVYGRDAWDGQLLVSLWRFTWYRDADPTLALSRLQQVEHEAFITLLAERRGVPVSHVVTAGLDVGRDALLVTERFGVGVDELAEPMSDAQLDAAWHALGRLHAAGISHGRLEAHRIRVDGDEVRLSDFAGADVVPATDRPAIDQVQLLIVTAVAVGVERAVARAAAALDTAGIARLTQFTQPAALTPSLRKAADAADIDVDDVRKALAELTDKPAGDLVKLRRLSIGSVLLTLLFIVACYALVSSVMDIGVDTIVDALRGASVPVMILAWLIGLTPRVSNAMALSSAAPSDIPLGRLTALQFAITFVNLAMPSTAARAAVVIRFFQRCGVSATQAVTIGVVDSVSGFMAQISLIVFITVFGFGSLNLEITDNLSANGLPTLVWILIGAVVVAIAIVAIVPKFRARVADLIRKGWTQAKPVLTSPGLLIRVYSYNLLSELLFSLCMYTVLRAFGQDVNYLDVVLVNVAVALFAGLMPVPGGVGVTEAALTAGFLAIGVDEGAAFAAALSYRLVTFYTQPIIGFGAFQWLKRQRYL